MIINKVVVDTSAWLSLLLTNDSNHKQIESNLVSFYTNGVAVFTTNDIVDETVTRLVYDGGLRIAQTFISHVDQGLKNRTLSQLWTDELIQHEAFAILNKFHDQTLSLTDATTIAIVNRFHLDAVLTLDSDFAKVGVCSLP